MDADDESSNYGVFMFAREILVRGGNGNPPSKGALAVYLRDQSRLILRVAAACTTGHGNADANANATACPGSSCGMFQHAFDAGEVAGALRGAHVSEEEALQTLAELLQDATAYGNGDDDNSYESLPGTSWATFRLDDDESAVAVRIRECTEPGLVLKRWRASIERLATPASVVPFTLSLVRTIQEKEAEAEHEIQEHRAAADQAKAEIEALTEDRDEYKKQVNVLIEKWNNEKTDLVDNFLVLYKAIQDERDRLNKELEKHKRQPRVGNAQRARTQVECESPPDAAGDRVAELPDVAQSPVIVSDPVAGPSDVAQRAGDARARPKNGRRASGSRDPPREGQKAKHRRVEVTSLAESSSDEQDLLSEDASLASPATSHESGAAAAPAGRSPASDSDDTTMEDVNADANSNTRKPASGRAPVGAGGREDMDVEDSPAPGRPTATAATSQDSSSDDDDSEAKAAGRRPVSTATNKRQPASNVAWDGSPNNTDGEQTSRTTKGGLAPNTPGDRQGKARATRDSGSTGPRQATSQRQPLLRNLLRKGSSSSSSSSDNSDEETSAPTRKHAPIPVARRRNTGAAMWAPKGRSAPTDSDCNSDPPIPSKSEVAQPDSGSETDEDACLA